MAGYITLAVGPRQKCNSTTVLTQFSINSAYYVLICTINSHKGYFPLNNHFFYKRFLQ